MTEQVTLMKRTRKERRDERLAKEQEELDKLEKEFKEGKEPQGEEVKAGESEDKTLEEVTPLSPEEETFKKRYADLRRHQAEKDKKHQEEVERLKKLQQKEGPPPASPEEVKAWVDEYPQVAAIIQSMAKDIAGEQLEEANLTIQSLRDSNEENVREKAFNAIRKAHPDFDALNGSHEFHDWADKQPPVIQNALYENSDDPNSVIRVLDLYKQDSGSVKPASKKQELEAALATDVTGGTSPSVEVKAKWSESRVNKLSSAEYAKHAQEIDEAIASGTFLFDMSK